jgi:hypothetical protein
MSYKPQILAIADGGTGNNVGATSGNLVLLSTQTVSSVSTVSFTSLISSKYNDYVLRITNLSGNQSVNNLFLRFSTNNGSSYISTANYASSEFLVNTGGNSLATNTGLTNAIVFTDIENATNGQGGGVVQFFNLSNGGVFPMYLCNGYFAGSFNTLFTIGGSYNSAITANAFQLVTDTGTVSGTFKFYGVEN